VLITSNSIVLSPTSFKSICVTFDYNNRLGIRAVSGCLYIYIYIYTYIHTASHNCISSIHTLCGSIAACFDPVKSSSGNHYMNMSLVIGLFIDMDPVQSIIILNC
jgi:hypothetical protein